MKKTFRKLFNTSFIIGGLFLGISFLFISTKFHPIKSFTKSTHHDIFAIETTANTDQYHTNFAADSTMEKLVPVQNIFEVNDTFTWLREPLLMRLPDGSLFCEIFTGGKSDGGKGNVIAAVRSDDDGETWTGIEVIKALKDTGCWASSVFVNNDKGYIFWYTMDKDRNNMTNDNAHLLSTGPDGRTFTQDQSISGNWESNQCVDIRRGVKLRNGKILLMGAWKEVISESTNETKIAQDDPRRKRWFNLGGASILNKVKYCGVVIPNDEFTQFRRFGRIRKLTPKAELPSVPFSENQIAELSNGTLAMLFRADLTNRIWRSDSYDGGLTWSDPVKTDIKNPGSKFLIINLPDGRIVLFNNPSEKNYDDITAHGHKYRTPLEMWVSDDDMKSWRYKKTLVAAPMLAQYPDGFYDSEKSCIYLVWEDDRTVYFKKISVKNL